jgi:hypothetical protein
MINLSVSYHIGVLVLVKSSPSSYEALMKYVVEMKKKLFWKDTPIWLTGCEN